MQQLFRIPSKVEKENFSDVMESAITLELATIPTYLSTYYSIERAPDQTKMYNKILGEMTKPAEALAQELTMDVLLYANKTAALIMGVVIEEMLHLALSSNVKQAICQQPPNLPAIGKKLTFPTQLPGHKPLFNIDLGPLSLAQLSTFLKIESPNSFVASKQLLQARGLEYTTIGDFYNQIETIIKEEYPGKYDLGDRLQLTSKPQLAIYSPNSINTVYYDRDHNPHFVNDDDSGGLIHVTDCDSAIAALDEIVEQGEGSSKTGDTLKLDENGHPEPLPVVDGKVKFSSGDFDDPDGQELAHFDKFLEAYSLGYYYQRKFAGYGLDFFDLFVQRQALSPKRADYENAQFVEVAEAARKYYPADDPQAALLAVSDLGNAVFSYILLLIEACYVTKSETAQYQIFMYGVHKSMIWLLSQFGRDLTSLRYSKDGKMYTAALTFEDYDFSQSNSRPKQQLIDLAQAAATAWPAKEGWTTEKEYDNYFPALPDVGLDYSYTPVDYSPPEPASTGSCPMGH